MKHRYSLLWTLPLLLCSCGTPEPSLPASSPEPSASITPSSGESSSPQASTPADGVFQFYCVNDFHGSIVEQMNGRYYESGIAKYFGKLKEYKAADPDHTFIFSAGDMFQGSLESNSNNGKLIVEAMNDVGFDAMTLGNHEFDYGLDRLLSNIEDLNCPVLGGNIMNYGTMTPWTEEIQISTVLSRDGNKIGVVGMIGSGQTTSITSSIVKDLDFVFPYDLALNEARRLREEEGCNIVLYLLHDDMSSCSTYAADKTYFDGVFCGHKHTKNLSLIQGVPFVQSYCNGEAISHFEITVKDGAATCTDYELISASSSWAEDPSIAAIRDKYILDPAFVAKSSAVAGTVQGTLGAKEGVANLLAQAMYDEAKKNHPDVRGALCNGQRASLSSEVRYRDIFKAAPFENQLVMASVKGSEILSVAADNHFYSGDNPYFDPDRFYPIAVSDFVLFRQNLKKQYSSFPSLAPGQGGSVIQEYEIYPYDLIFNHIHDHLGGRVDASDYRNTSPGFGARSL